MVFRARHPSDRAGLGPLQAQALATQPPAGFRGGGHPPSKPCRGAALVCLGETSDRQEPVGRGSNQPLLEVFDRPPSRVRGGAIETFWPSSSLAFHGVPGDVGPRGGGGGCRPCSEKHRRTSPKRRTLLDGSTVRTPRKSAPFRLGSLCLSGRPSPRGYRAACAFAVFFSPLCRPPSWRSGYHGRGEQRAYPVVDEAEGGPVRWESVPRWAFGCRHPQALEVILPTYPCGDGLSASWAMSLARGCTRTLHGRST
jgi:hypothetical protein